MINKLDLQNIINKYYLNGTIETVKWDINDDILNIKFTSPSREMIGEITQNNFKLEKSSFGISNTTQLLKLINITHGDVLLSFVKNNKIFSKLIIADDQFTVNYSLADILTVPKAGAYSGPDEWDIEVELDIENINALIKAKSALPESTTVVIKPFTSLDGDPQLEIVFGGDVEYANKVSYYLNISKNISKEFELGFNSDLLKEILSVNKESTTFKMYLNLEGLIKLYFTSPNTTSTYYLVKKDI